MIRLLAWAAILGLAAIASAQAPKPGTVGFRGKYYEPAQLPAEVGPAAKAAVNSWAPWAKSNGYRLDLDPSRRVLLISSRSNVDAPLALVVRTVAFFDALFPAPVTPPSAESADAAAPSVPKPGGAPPDDVIPEDPETPPPGAPKTLPPSRGKATATERKAPEFRADSQTAVMLVIRNSADYAALLDFLAAGHPYLADWKDSALPQIGFALDEPLCGAYNENSPGQEEWSPDNELVHRTMALLVLRRFSAQPYWLHTALCWSAEMGVMKSIYCMPNRDGFVAIGEHGGWIEELGSIYSGRGAEPLRVQEFALRRGQWDGKLAKTALGMVDYLGRQNPRALSALMEALRVYADKNGRKTNSDGSWTRIRDYEVPAEQEKLLLERHFGVNVLRDVIAHWTGAPSTPVK